MAETESDNDIENWVLNAARDLLAHYGYDKTTMNDIAQQAGVAKSTIYLHWRKKEDLFDALLIREGTLLIEDWFSRVGDDPNGGTFPAFYRHGLELLLENDFLIAIYSRDRQLLGGMIKRIGISNLYLQRQNMLMDFFSALQSAGVVRADIDGHTLAYLLNSIQYGLIEMDSIIPEDQSPNVNESMTMLADIIEGYVTPHDGGNSEAGKQVLRQLKQQVDAVLTLLNNR